MKKTEIWEGILLLISAVMLLPIWLAYTGTIQFPPPIFTLLEFLLYPLLIVLAVILVRRIRRLVMAFRKNNNRSDTS